MENPGWLIGILILVYEIIPTYIGRYFNPYIYKKNNQGQLVTAHMDSYCGRQCFSSNLARLKGHLLRFATKKTRWFFKKVMFDKYGGFPSMVVQNGDGIPWEKESVNKNQRKNANPSLLNTISNIAPNHHRQTPQKIPSPHLFLLTFWTLLWAA